MIAQRWYTRTNEWWIGRKVRTLDNIRTRAGLTLAEGSICEVVRKFKGLTLRTERCVHCGVQFEVAKMALGRLDWADEETRGRQKQ